MIQLAGIMGTIFMLVFLLSLVDVFIGLISGYISPMIIFIAIGGFCFFIAWLVDRK